MSHTPEPWEWWTSCSFNRLTGPDGKDGSVAYAYNNPADGHPDICISEADMARIVACVNSCKGITDPETAIPQLVGTFSDLRDRLLRLGPTHYLGDDGYTVDEETDATAEMLDLISAALALVDTND